MRAGFATEHAQIFGRLDYVLSNNTQVYARVNWTDEVDFSGAAFGSPYAQYTSGLKSMGSFPCEHVAYFHADGAKQHEAELQTA